MFYICFYSIENFKLYVNYLHWGMAVKASQMNAPRKTIEVINCLNSTVFSEPPPTLEDFLFSASFLLTFWDLLVKSSKRTAQHNIKSVLQQALFN